MQFTYKYFNDTLNSKEKKKLKLQTDISCEINVSMKENKIVIKQ